MEVLTKNLNPSLLSAKTRQHLVFGILLVTEHLYEWWKLIRNL
jgi:hypothetical protein